MEEIKYQNDFIENSKNKKKEEEIGSNLDESAINPFIDEKDSFP